MDKRTFRDLAELCEKSKDTALIEAIRPIILDKFLPAILVDALAENWPQKLGTVKYIKANSTLGLKEAKDFVDQYWATSDE